MACKSCEEYSDRVTNLNPPTLQELLQKKYIQNCDACDAFCKDELRKTGKYPRKKCDRMAHYAQHGRLLLERQVKKARASGFKTVPFMSDLGASFATSSLIPAAPTTRPLPPLRLPMAPTTPLPLPPPSASVTVTVPVPVRPGGRGGGGGRPPIRPPGKPQRTKRMQMLLEFIRINQNNGIPFPDKDMIEYDLCKYVKWYMNRLESIGVKLNYNVPSLMKKRK